MIFTFNIQKALFITKDFELTFEEANRLIMETLEEAYWDEMEMKGFI